MEYVQGDDPSGACVHEEASSEQSISRGSVDGSDTLGNDEKELSRVGDQYQAEIPPLVPNSVRLRLMKKPDDPEFMVDEDHSFSIGLPVPIMWVHVTVDKLKTASSEFRGDPNVEIRTNRLVESRKVNSNDGDLALKGEPSDVAFDSWRGVRVSVGCELVVAGPQSDVNLSSPENGKSDLEQYKGQGYCSSSGSLSSSWSKLAQESLLLGLYIFGKNFVQRIC